MARPWTPTANARLTLKQLGLSAAQIQAAISAYRRQPGDNSEKSDQSFMRFARHSAEAPALERRLTELLGIALDWQPSNRVQQELVAAGFHPEAIDHYRTLFVVSTREQGRALRDPGRAFLAFCRRRATSLPAPMSADWLPRTDTLQQLVREHGLDDGRIPDLIERFIHAHQGRLSPDWDHTFAGWVEQGRAEGRAAC
jgi:DnaT DNA-binding domain